jgi:hypothetical protein
MNTTKMPGFTAELSLVRTGNHYRQFATHSRAMSGAVQPALKVTYKRICWCAEGGMCEVKKWYEVLLGLGGKLVECCLREECVEVPIFY